MTLKEAYAPFFKIGTSASIFNMGSDKAKEELKKHYSSMTAENDMKPMYLLDEKACTENPAKYNTQPALCFDKVRKYLDFAKESGIALRGHTLVWHGQTPFWFFKEGYSKEMESPLVDRETMLARMEWFIKGVLEFYQTEYPGVIYAWDVVNEAIEENEEDGWRKSLWFKTIGDDFVLQAFRFARKYAAKGVSLFYNDYNTFMPKKREAILKNILEPLMAEKLIDGMGMQSHLIIHDSNMKDYEESLHCFGALGLEVQATEIDIHNNDNSEERNKELADAYAELFGMYVKAKKEGKANITSVTLWGMKDDESWLSGFRKERSYPLLFDDNWNEKEAYHAVIKVAEDN